MDALKVRPLAQRVEWLEDELEPRAGGLADWITANVTKVTPMHPAQIGAFMLELSGNPRPAISSGRRAGKTAALAAGQPPDSTVRPGSPAYTVLTGWDVPPPGSVLHTQFGPITVLRTRWSGLGAGDVLRSQRTGENMAVVHAPAVNQPGTLYVTRGIGSVMPMALQVGDVLDFVAETGTSKWSAHSTAPIAPRPMRPAAAMHYARVTRAVNSLPGLGPQGEIELAIEPVIAFRVFKIDVDDVFEIALRSVSYDTLWPRQAELVATCRHLGSDPDPDHEAPMPGCTCGIYLTKTIAQALEQATGQVLVLAVVRGWGKVVKHETGWRVQKAYPVGLAVLALPGSKRGEAAAEKLRDAYAVPVKLLGRPAPTGDVSAEDFAIGQGWLGGE